MTTTLTLRGGQQIVVDRDVWAMRSNALDTFSTTDIFGTLWTIPWKQLSHVDGKRIMTITLRGPSFAIAQFLDDDEVNPPAPTRTARGIGYDVVPPIMSEQSASSEPLPTMTSIGRLTIAHSVTAPPIGTSNALPTITSMRRTNIIEPGGPL